MVSVGFKVVQNFVHPQYLFNHIYPFLPLTWHLFQGTWKTGFVLDGPLVRCHVSGKEASPRPQRRSLLPNQKFRGN